MKISIKHTLVLASLVLFQAHAVLAADLMEGYHLVQTALAKDEFPAVKDLSAHYLTDISEWLKAEKETNPQYKNVQALYSGAESLAGTSLENEQRVRFGVLSQALVTFVRQDKALQAAYQLFYCPMVANGYAYWVQPKGEKINNPYMGLSMPTCGSKKPWPILRGF